MAKEWWRGAVIYQIYPRSFQDSTGNGVGDLPGIRSRLEHIAALGVDAIWLSPIFTSPMKDMGYDVSDYTNIDPLFGTLEDFDALVRTAHDLGLKVIIDQVLSHSSDQHPFFATSRQDRTNPKADWYVWADPKPDGSAPNNWLSVFGGSAWEWEPRRQQYYLHNFLIEQPDFNCHNPEVQEWLLSTMRFWLDRGVDGFRLDTVNYYMHDPLLRDNPPEPREEGAIFVNTYDMQDHVYSKTRPENLTFLERMRTLTDQYDNRAMVGEVGEGRRAIEVMADYTSGNKRLHMAYSFDMLGPNFNAAHFRSRITAFFDGAQDAWPNWAFSNHDVNRHVTRWQDHAESSDELAHQSIAMLTGFEGTIGVYQGEELRQSEAQLEYHELTDPPGLRFWPMNKGRDGCRTPMVWEREATNGGFSTAARPWLPVKRHQLDRAVDVQQADNDSVLHKYQSMLAFRQASDVLKHGKTEFIDVPEPILAFCRVLGQEMIACIYNLSANSIDLNIVGGAPTGPRQNVNVNVDVSASATPSRWHFGPNAFLFLEASTSSKITVSVSDKAN